MPQRTFLHRVLCLTAAAMLLMPSAVLAGATPAANADNNNLPLTTENVGNLRTSYSPYASCENQDSKQFLSQTLEDVYRATPIIFVGTVTDRKSRISGKVRANQCWVTFSVNEWLKNQGDFLGAGQKSILIRTVYHPDERPYELPAARMAKNIDDLSNCPYHDGEKYLVLASYYKQEKEPVPFIETGCFPIWEIENVSREYEALHGISISK